MQDPAWVQCQRGTGPMYQTRGPVPLLQRAQFKNLFSLDFYSSLILNCVFAGGFAQAGPNPLQN